MANHDPKNLQIHTSGPLRLVVVKKDPVPAKAAPSRDSWTLLMATGPVRICTGEDHEEGIVPRGSLALLLPHSLHQLLQQKLASPQLNGNISKQQQQPHSQHPQ